MYRSKIRIRDGRAKPIDLLAKYISAEDDDLAVEMHEPYTFLNGLTVTDMDDLLEDIKVSVCVCVYMAYADESFVHQWSVCGIRFMHLTSVADTHAYPFSYFRFYKVYAVVFCSLPYVCG